MSDPWFFGYGSLVNRATHDYLRAERARLRGWRRVWRHTPLRPLAFLTVEPDPDSAIDGLIAEVPGADWRVLDDRERAYDRVIVSDNVVHPVDPAPHVSVYAIAEGRHGPATETHPVLLSYIDTVVQGFLAEFGEDGAWRFFETTRGWDAPILNDRAAPVYSRHRLPTARERGLVDEALAAMGASTFERGS